MTFADARDVALRFLSASVPTPDDAIPGPVVRVWPSAPASFTYPLADRDAEMTFFRKFVTDQVAERIYLVSGPSDRGKSTLLREFVRAARGLPGLFCADARLSTGRSLKDLIWDLSADLAAFRLPRLMRDLERKASTEDLLSSFLLDLREARSPLVLVIDAFDKATEDAQEWIETRLLEECCSRDGLRVVVAGQRVPAVDNGGPVAERTWHCALPTIPEPAAWEQFGCTVLGLKREHDFALLVDASDGNPGVMRTLLETLKRRRG